MTTNKGGKVYSSMVLSDQLNPVGNHLNDVGTWSTIDTSRMDKEGNLARILTI